MAGLIFLSILNHFYRFFHIPYIAAETNDIWFFLIKIRNNIYNWIFNGVFNQINSDIQVVRMLLNSGWLNWCEYIWH